AASALGERSCGAVGRKIGLASLLRASQAGSCCDRTAEKAVSDNVCERLTAVFRINGWQSDYSVNGMLTRCAGSRRLPRALCPFDTAHATEDQGACRGPRSSRVH